MGQVHQNGPKVVPNGSLENYCKVSNGHIIGHVLVGQNRGSTHLHYSLHICLFVDQINI